MTRKFCLAVLCAITAGFNANAADEAKALTVESPAVVGCENPDAGTPEEYSLFGKASDLQSKISAIDADLSKRKIFVVTIEDEDGTEAFLYRRGDEEGKMQLTHWVGLEKEGIRASIENAIVENKGIQCVGEQTKSLLDGLDAEPKDNESIQAPANLKAIVSHAIQARGESYVRLSLILLC